MKKPITNIHFLSDLLLKKTKEFNEQEEKESQEKGKKNSQGNSKEKENNSKSSWITQYIRGIEKKNSCNNIRIRVFGLFSPLNLIKWN